MKIEQARKNLKRKFPQITEEELVKIDHMVYGYANKIVDLVIQKSKTDGLQID